MMSPATTLAAICRLLLQQATRNATVRCVEPLDVLALPKREFAVLAAHLPDMRRNFETLAAQRARGVERTGG